MVDQLTHPEAMFFKDHVPLQHVFHCNAQDRIQCQSGKALNVNVGPEEEVLNNVLDIMKKQNEITTL